MQRVGTHGIGARGLDHPVLQHQQCHGHHQRKYDHANSDPRCAHRLGVFQPFDGLKGDQYCTHPDKQCLSHAGQRLGLAVTVAVIFIGGAQGVMHGQQIEKRGHAIEQRVGQPGEHADRATEPPGDGLGHDQQTRHRHRRTGGEA